MNSTKSHKNILITAGSALAALAFLGAGGSKLAGSAMQLETFQNLGLPVWFMYLTGAIEAGAALLLLRRATRFVGASLLGATMVGAVSANMIAAVPMSKAMPAFILLAAVASIAWATREQLGSLLGAVGLRPAPSLDVVG
jgi:hypothetical protein